MKLYCQQCRMPIAAFDKLKHPITPDQFSKCHPDRPITRAFGGELQTAISFICPRCGRWPFESEENTKRDADGRKTGRQEPVRVRVAFETGDKSEWYGIPDDQEQPVILNSKKSKAEEFKCACGYETNYPHLMGRHKKGCSQCQIQ